MVHDSINASVAKKGGELRDTLKRKEKTSCTINLLNFDFCKFWQLFLNQKL